ncbi:cytochrome P450 [Prauserella shujinwangii]|uniref:Cytochrome P450 n=1 Tax=Prauserella shujinwangii TaxID=1453103 RepID=A0A2T0LQ67_9PSEU|nr:cytochrome P450 [Prauserella shujinwangii]PRX45469.1 cytochrome P450 [Prauserella shujinwangii]
MSSTPRPATRTDTARVLGQVVLPTLAGGVLKRRPKVMALAGRLRLDRPAVRLLRRLRSRYGPDPVPLRIPRRSFALVLDAGDVERVLDRTPAPFAPATREKSAALSHFQPHAVLTTRGSERRPRRRFNEDALEWNHPLHAVAGAADTAVREETARLLAETGDRLDWPAFNRAWWRIVRRIVLGDGARDDDEVTDALATLRYHGNWAYLRPKDRGLRERFRRTLARHLDRAERGSLAGAVADTPAEPGVDPYGQVPHWLFAFDAVGMVTLRTLALLATHPVQAASARAEAGDAMGPSQLPYLRACVLESVRLWPTTPIVLRESTETTEWRTGNLPPETTFVVFSPFFHRDRERLPFADRFDPDVWLDGRAQQDPALVPFSEGPGECPGQNLALFTASTMLAALLADRDYRLLAPRTTARRLGSGRRLPATLDNFGLRFAVTKP